MKVTKFMDEITRLEGGKKILNRGDIGETLKLANKKLNGELYKLIRKLEE